MKTASFFTYTGPGRISIARWAPPGHPAGYRVYRPLNPKREWMRLAAAEFDPVYRAMLAEFDPHQVWDELHFLANGVEPVLLCWEPPGRPCHRRHVAWWFRQTLGHVVEGLV